MKCPYTHTNVACVGFEPKRLSAEDQQFKDILSHYATRTVPITLINLITSYVSCRLPYRQNYADIADKRRASRPCDVARDVTCSSVERTASDSTSKRDAALRGFGHVRETSRVSV